MEWQVASKGIIWQIMQGTHTSGKVFEKAVRSPGSRLLIISDNAVLLSKEKRRELGGKVDYRLPGGKVFDTSEEYEAFLESGSDILEASRKSASKEALEETGLVIDHLHLEYMGTDVLGATCEWDLIYWLAKEYSEHERGAQHHESEADEIVGMIWVSYEEAKKIALDPDQFSEGRSARMLLGYLSKQ